MTESDRAFVMEMLLAGNSETNDDDCKAIYSSTSVEEMVSLLIDSCKMQPAQLQRIRQLFADYPEEFLAAVADVEDIIIYGETCIQYESRTRLESN